MLDQRRRGGLVKPTVEESFGSVLDSRRGTRSEEMDVRTKASSQRKQQGLDKLLLYIGWLFRNRDQRLAVPTKDLWIITSRNYKLD